MPSASAVPSGARLLPDHVEVLDLVADGLPNHEIARRLRIAPDTVSTRLKAAARILGTAGRTGMVAECYRRGVFTPNPARGGAPAPDGRLAALLPLLVRGASNAECARVLGIDEATVKRRVPALYRALGAVNRAHLPRRAADSGLLSQDLRPAASPPPGPESADLPAPPLLSPLQERVLRMLASGLEPPAIAVRLKVGPGAVRQALREAMAALGARTVAHAVLLGCRAGILPGGAR